MRVPPVPTWQKTFEPLGAMPTTVEAAETYSALSQGVVDAGESPLTGLRANRWYEVVKNITLTGHFNLFTGWVISEAAFQSLREDDRAMLLDEFRKGGQELTRRAAALNGQIRKEFEAAGVKFHDADIPAYRKATASFYTSFPNGRPGCSTRFAPRPPEAEHRSIRPAPGRSRGRVFVTPESRNAFCEEVFRGCFHAGRWRLLERCCPSCFWPS